MQVERVIAGVETLGPGKRICIWVNGCNRDCAGCVSPELRKYKPENECDITAVIGKFDLSRFDGVTVSGGEPFEQTAELAKLAEFVRSRGVKDVLVYTGYTIEQLRARKDDTTDYVLENIGVLIDGPYIDGENNDKGNLKGSDNQRVIFVDDSLKDKYAAYYSDERKMQEFFMFPHMVAVGIPTKKFVDDF
ncbi:MAG: 4Fe-4S single cluster domain-containing protein [Clostridia bacterium]|nr:4Fe-4S single cluster domain-containing protein [Clostridia bacterium]